MTLADVRDIAVIIVAIGSLIQLIIMIVLLWFVLKLVRLVMGKTDELTGKAGEMMVLGQGVIKSAQQTADTAAKTATSMKGSAEFVTDTVVSPVVQVVSAVAGARGFVAALFRLSNRRENGGSK